MDTARFLEAIYAETSSEATWLDGVVRAVRPRLDAGLGVLGYTFRRAADGRVQVGQPVGRGVDASAVVAFLAASALAQGDVLDAAYYRAPPCTTYSEVVGATALRDSWLARTLGDLTGVRDFLALKAVDADGTGVALGALLPAARALSSHTRTELEQLAAHIAAAHRLRARSAPRRDGLPGGTEAVLDAAHRVVHAEGDAREVVRELEAAAARLAHGASTGDPARILASRPALVDARWSLVEHGEAAGRRFLVARRNAPAGGASPALSERESQVTAFVALGHSHKLIAYELGLTSSTVRTLERRAMQKLGARSRFELIALVSALRLLPARAAR